MLILNKIDPKLKKAITDIRDVIELDSGKIYLLEVSSNMPTEQIKALTEIFKDQFKDKGIHFIFITEGTIKNVYELEGGDINDSGTSFK